VASADESTLRARRIADESFKLSVVGQQAEIKTKIDALAETVKSGFHDHSARLESIEKVIWGYKSESAGLLEQNRNLIKDMGKLFGTLGIVGFILVKIVSPLYDAWILRFIPPKTAAVVQPTKLRKELPP
jgi:hypothetical protein